MQRWRWKLSILLILILACAYYIAFQYPISSGKRVGNLTKLSRKGSLIKTWEGTLNEGYGEKLTTYFSINDNKIAEELFEHEGREVVVYYEEHYWGWPNDTHYDVVRWHPQNNEKAPSLPQGADNTAELKSALQIVSQQWQLGLFCSLLGTLATDADFYQKVKAHVKSHNPYLAEQFQKCNEKPTSSAHQNLSPKPSPEASPNPLPTT